MSNILIGLKKTVLGILEIGDRDKNNEIGLKEGGGIEILTTVLPLRDARSFAINTYHDQHANQSKYNSFLHLQ